MARHSRSHRREEITLDDVTVVDQKLLRKALIGTVVGNFMEWYDVAAYSYLAVVLGALFLPESSPAVRNMFTLGVFAVTFIARPLGGMVLGQLGDRVGRQKILAFTLAMMALATFLIGILPTYDQIGFWAPLLLVVLKLAQGFSTGGEYAGASTFLTEYAPDRRRGFLSSTLEIGSYGAYVIGAGVVTLLQFVLSHDAVYSWGWRLPFLAALPLGFISLYLRTQVEDSPAFVEASKRAEKSAAQDGPKNLRELIAAHKRELITVFATVAAAQTCGYALTSYMPTYLVTTLGFDEDHGTAMSLVPMIAMTIAIPLVGALSDRIGRRTVMFIGAGGAIVLAVPAFLAMNHATPTSAMIGLFTLAVPVTFYVASQTSALPAQFPTSSRYGGMGLAYNFAVAVFAGTAPFIMETLVTATGNPLTPAFWIIATSVMGFAAIVYLKESARRPMPGAQPVVASNEEAVELVRTQHDNDDLDVSEIVANRVEED